MGPFKSTRCLRNGFPVDLAYDVSEDCSSRYYRQAHSGSLLSFAHCILDSTSSGSSSHACPFTDGFLIVHLHDTR